MTRRPVNVLSIDLARSIDDRSLAGKPIGFAPGRAICRALDIGARSERPYDPIMSNERYTKIGWWLFVGSAVLFGLSALRARDWIAMAGAGAFLFANLSFMAALYRDDSHRED
jgi:hypothetical protein